MTRVFCLLILCITFSLVEGRSSYADIVCDALSQDDTYKNKKSFRKLVSGKNGWIFRTTTDFQENFDLNDLGVRRFQRLKQAFDTQGMELVIALIPTRGMMHADVVMNDGYDVEVAWKSYNKLAVQLEEHGIPVATATKEAGDFFYKRDHHWNADGARFMAQQVAEKIHNMTAFSDITKQEYITETGDGAVQGGTFTKFINEKCQSEIVGEDISLFVTARKDQSLFDDQPKADILLVGTSNSTHTASKANFDGFLREYIGADVENISVSGGGEDTAFYNWLHSDAYKDQKPKVVIWEVPVYQGFDSGPFFRQLIPAVYSECDPVTQEEGLVMEKAELFNSVWSNENRTGKDLYALVSVEGKGIRKLRAVTEYESGKKDVVGLQRSKRYEGDNIFYFELNQNRSEIIKTLTLSFPKSAIDLKMKASLCAYPSSM